MITFLKQFNQKIGKTVSLVMVFVLTAYALYRGLSADLKFIDYLIGIIYVVIFSAMILISAVKGKQLLAHLILLIAFYDNSVRAFFDWVFTIGSNEFEFSWQILIMVVISVYLILQIVSLILAGVKLEIKWSKTLGLVALLFVFFALSNSITESVSLILIPLLAVMMYAPLVSTLGVIVTTAAFPINMVYGLFNDQKYTGAGFFTTILATLLLVLAVIHFTKIVKTNKV